MPMQLFNAILEQAVHDGSRSTVLKPLNVASVIFLSAILISFYIQAPQWISIIFTAILVVVMILFIYAFFYFMKASPDSLRSEKYSLKKLQIEKGLVGDDKSGVLEQNSTRENYELVEMSGDDELRAGK